VGGEGRTDAGPRSRVGRGPARRAQADGRSVVDAGALWGELFFFGLRGSRRGLSLGTGASSGRLLGTGRRGRGLRTWDGLQRRAPAATGGRLDGERVEYSVSST